MARQTEGGSCIICHSELQEVREAPDAASPLPGVCSAAESPSTCGPFFATPAILIQGAQTSSHTGKYLLISW